MKRLFLILPLALAIVACDATPAEAPAPDNTVVYVPVDEANVKDEPRERPTICNRRPEKCPDQP